MNGTDKAIQRSIELTEKVVDKYKRYLKDAEAREDPIDMREDWVRYTVAMEILNLLKAQK